MIYLISSWSYQPPLNCFLPKLSLFLRAPLEFNFLTLFQINSVISCHSCFAENLWVLCSHGWLLPLGESSERGFGTCVGNSGDRILSEWSPRLSRVLGRNNGLCCLEAMDWLFLTWDAHHTSVLGLGQLDPQESQPVMAEVESVLCEGGLAGRRWPGLLSLTQLAFSHCGR